MVGILKKVSTTWLSKPYLVFYSFRFKDILQLSQVPVRIISSSISSKILMIDREIVDDGVCLQHSDFPRCVGYDFALLLPPEKQDRLCRVSTTAIILSILPNSMSFFIQRANRRINILTTYIVNTGCLQSICAICVLATVSSLKLSAAHLSPLSHPLVCCNTWDLRILSSL